MSRASRRPHRFGWRVALRPLAVTLGLAPVLGACNDSSPVEGGADNTPPVVEITAPVDGHSAVAGEGLHLSGLASDQEDGDLTARITWASDRDGALGTGSTVAPNLTVGTHEISARVADDNGATAADTISLDVLPNQTPTLEIQSPGADTTVAVGSTLTLVASATDPEDGNLSSEIQWSSDLEGELGTGASVAVTLIEGIHTIRAVADDGVGNRAADSVQVTVVTNGAVAIEFVVEPIRAMENQSLDTVLVQAVDAAGNTVDSFAGTIALAARTPAGDDLPLAGTTEVAAVAGVASFPGAVLPGPTPDAVLVASSSGLPDAVGAPFTVEAEPLVVDTTALVLRSDSTALAEGRLDFDIVGSLPDLAVGRVIVVAGGGAGFIGRIVDATVSGGRLTVNTSSVDLTDIVQSGTLRVEFGAGAGAAGVPPPYFEASPQMQGLGLPCDASADTTIEVICSVENLTLFHSSGGHFTLTDVSVSFGYAGSFDVEIARFRIRRIHLELAFSSGYDFGVDLGFQSDIQSSGSVSAGLVRLPFRAQIGFLPVTGEFSIPVTIDWSFSAGGQVSVTARGAIDNQTSITAGWVPERGWDFDSQSQPSFAAQLTPHVNAALTASIGAGVAARAELYNTLGFQVGIVRDRRIEAEVDVPANSWSTSCSSGWALNARLDFSLFRRFVSDYSRDIAASRTEHPICNLSGDLGLSALVADPAQVSLAAVSGSTASPAAASITADGLTAVDGLQTTTTYGPGQPEGWLTPHLASAATPTTLTIDASAAALPVGSYDAVVEVGTSDPDSGVDPVTVEVTFTVTPTPDPAELTNGLLHDGTIAVPLEQDEWTFSADAGDHIDLRIAEVDDFDDFRPSIEVRGPGGDVVDSGQGRLVGELQFRAPVSGTYEVTVSSGIPAAGQEPLGTGQYRLVFLRVPGDISVGGDDHGGSLANGAEVEGSLVLGDLDPWWFEGDAGDHVEARLTQTAEIGDFRPWLFLVSASGEVVDAESATDVADLAVTLPASGRYVLVAGSYRTAANAEATGAGDYRLTLARAPADFQVPEGDEGGDMDNGERRDGEITRGDLDLWRFDVGPGEHIQVRIAELGELTDFRPSMVLIGPDRSVVSADGRRADEILATAAQAGTFTVLVRSARPSAGAQPVGEGSYRLSLATAPSSFAVPGGDEGGTAVPTGADGSIPIGDLDLWTFDGAADDFLALRVAETAETEDFRPAAWLVAPSGAMVGVASGRRVGELVVQDLPETGSYTVVVASARPGAGADPVGSGDYTIFHARAPGGAGSSDGSIARGELDLQHHDWAEGDTIEITLVETDDVDDFRPQFRVIDPDGIQVDGGSGATQTDSWFIAPKDGTYTIVIASAPPGAGADPTGVGSYDLSVVVKPGGG